MTQISREISDLVMEFGGAMSGEHGDGLARSHLNEKLFGAELYQEFRKVKRLFDPHNLLNPGKIVDAPAMTDSLRYGTSYKTWQPDTMLDFSDQGGFVAAVEMCNGTRRLPQDPGRHHVSVLHGHPWRRSIPPAGAPPPSARCCPARCRARSSPASGSTRCWTCAWSARAARPNAPPMSTWPSSSTSSCTTTSRSTGCRCEAGCSAASAP